MEIKLNDDFIFGEGVSDNKDIAYGVALDDLLIFANEVKERNSQEKLSMSDLITQVETLVYENGTRYEVLVYIPFKIVIDTQKKESSAKSGIRLTRPGILELEEEDEPIEVEPIITENLQVDEASVKEEVEIKEEPEPLAVTESAVAETASSEEVPRIIPAPEPPKVTATEANSNNSNSTYEGEVEGLLLTQDNFTEIKPFLSEMKRSGRIVETGAADSLNGLPQDASLILIDELGGILALLSPATPQGRMNYKTHKPDSENNYNSKFIVWYRK